jgi:ISXO2-like transposase domain
MTPKEFHEKFPNEYACRDFWKALREEAGIKCKKCGGEDHYWNHGKNEWRCRKCKSVTTIKSGTVMMHSNLSLMVWFKAIFEVTYRRKSISATELYKQFPEIKGEGTAWYLLHKIRLAMGYRDEQYQIEGDAEIDDAFVTVVKVIKDEAEKSKRGRGAVRKAPILVMASYETIPSERQKRNRPNSFPLFFKMFQMEDLRRDTVNEKVFRYIKLTSNIKSDAYRGYTDFKKLVEKHQAKVIPAKRGHIELPWVHCAIGNLKRWINGIFHHVSDVYLQNYLDEFVYTLNRRNIERPFDHLLKACLVRPWGQS